MKIKSIFTLSLLAISTNAFAECPLLTLDEVTNAAFTNTLEKDGKSWIFQPNNHTETFNAVFPFATGIVFKSEEPNPHMCHYTLEGAGTEFTLIDTSESAPAVHEPEVFNPGEMTVGELTAALNTGEITVGDIRYLLETQDWVSDMIGFGEFDNLRLTPKPDYNDDIKGDAYELEFASLGGLKGYIFVKEILPPPPVLAPLPVPGVYNPVSAAPAPASPPRGNRLRDDNGASSSIPTEPDTTPQSDVAALKVRYDAIMANVSGNLPPFPASVAGLNLSIQQKANTRPDGEYIRNAWSTITNRGDNANKLGDMDAAELIRRIWAKVRTDRTDANLDTFINRIANMGENGASKIYNRLVMLIQTLEEIS